MPPTYTLRLDEVDNTQAAIGGGKGASLGELSRAGIRVPPGFIVILPAFEAFMAAADPHGAVKHWLGQVDADQARVTEAAQAIHELLREADLPTDVEIEIQDAVRQLGCDSVSVRSSATCEDGTSSAWAGQLETYLDVGPAAVMARVKDCWLSIFRPAALAYGAAHGYGAGEFGVAVVVQQMIFSEVSGIGFSVHPVTQEPDVRLIEACFGLGEAIVSGQILPDQYVVKRGAQQLMEYTPGAQQKGLFLEHGQDQPEWRDLGPRGEQPKLTEAQVLDYARLLDRIEQHYGFPVDSEWALMANEFHVLQSRPITTLAKEYRESIIDETVPWQLGFRRPLSLLETSVIAQWNDTPHSGEEFGFHLDRFLAIQDASDLTTMFFSREEFQGALQQVCQLDQSDRPRLVRILQQAQEVYQQELERIEGGSPLASIDEAAEHLIRIGRFTTSFPAMTLLAMDFGHLDDPEVCGLAEELRSKSLYPRFVSRRLDPIVHQWARKLGFAAAELAPQLVTWPELRDQGVDRQTLEQRWAQIQAGDRFVYQYLSGVERLDFVSETGYLMMREVGQRKIVPPDDP
ncbi:MAG: PEP/pyruvate-binding domain-containing protein, partial [Planctomycetota bacterium]